MSDVLIPPDIVPQEETIELVDDGTNVFRPTLSQGLVQRAQSAEPRLKVTQMWRSLRLEDKARMMAVLGQLKGRYNSLRALVGYSKRGSFPSTEAVSNNSFSGGTASWSGLSAQSIAVTDRVMRITATDGNNTAGITQSVSVSQYFPYVARTFISADTIGVGSGPYVIDSGVVLGSSLLTGSGLRLSSSMITLSTSATYRIYAAGNLAALSGAYVDTTYSSLTRCVSVDNGLNSLTYSDQISNAAWTKYQTTVTADAYTAPDGTVTADAVTENTATDVHSFFQTQTRATGIAEICSYGCFKRVVSTRDVTVEASNNTTTDYCRATFDLNAGTVGSVTNAGSATNGRAFIKSLGNNWYFCCVIGRMPSSTSITSQYYLTSSGSINYTGTTGAIAAWRCGAAISSSPTRGSQTTSSASTGTSQTGSALYVKGGPASASASLQAGDPVEINGELKMLTASVDFDAAGLGYMQFSPALVRSPADNDPVVIGQPLGRFMLADNPKWSNQYGQYADLTLTFEHIYE